MPGDPDIQALVKANAAIPVKEGEGLKVINAGLPRVSSLLPDYRSALAPFTDARYNSIPDWYHVLYVALGMLGFRTHHMIEIMVDIENSTMWNQILDGKIEPDWRKVYKGYTAAVDSPTGDYYLELSKAFPDAKVIISTRDPDKWWYSLRTVLIEPHLGNPYHRIAVWWFKAWRQQLRIGDALVTQWEKKYGEIGPGLVEKRLAEVQKNIPKDNLLVYRVQEGWEPLCKFLDVPAPDKPFPHLNDGKSMRAMFLKGIAVWAAVTFGTIGIAMAYLPLGALVSRLGGLEIWSP